MHADVVETAAWTQGSRHLQAEQFDQSLYARNNLDLFAAAAGFVLAVLLLLGWLVNTLLTYVSRPGMSHTNKDHGM